MSNFSSTKNKFELWEKMKEQQGSLHISVYNDIPELFEKTIQEIDSTEGDTDSKNKRFITLLMSRIQQKSREAYFEQRFQQYEHAESIDFLSEINKINDKIDDLQSQINRLNNSRL